MSGHHAAKQGSLTSVPDAYLELEILFGFKSDTAP